MSSQSQSRMRDRHDVNIEDNPSLRSACAKTRDILRTKHVFKAEKEKKILYKLLKYAEILQ